MKLNWSDQSALDVLHHMPDFQSSVSAHYEMQSERGWAVSLALRSREIGEELLGKRCAVDAFPDFKAYGF